LNLIIYTSIGRNNLNYCTMRARGKKRPYPFPHKEEPTGDRVEVRYEEETSETSSSSGLYWQRRTHEHAVRLHREDAYSSRISTKAHRSVPNEIPIFVQRQSSGERKVKLLPSVEESEELTYLKRCGSEARGELPGIC
jgi:hypothetical protein